MTFRSDPATGCGWLIIIAAALLASVVLVATGFLIGRATASTPRPAQSIPASAFAPIRGQSTVGEPDPERTGAPWSSRPLVSGAPSTPEPAAIPLRRAPGSLEGVASWGCCWAGVVTRLPRGTVICVTGPLGSWCGRSVGFGPAVSTGRIADLSMAVFREVCGSLRMGLCRVTLSW